MVSDPWSCIRPHKDAETFDSSGRTMKDMNKLFFELIQVAIGKRVCLSYPPSATVWQTLYEMAKKQSLVGICFAGAQRLVSRQQTPPEMLYLQWMGMATCDTTQKQISPSETPIPEVCACDTAIVIKNDIIVQDSCRAYISEDTMNLSVQALK